MTRRFEFISGSSTKFWQVTVAGSEVTVCFGRIGTAGQSQTKTLANPAAAQKHAEGLINQKLGKGYVEVALAA